MVKRALLLLVVAFASSRAEAKNMHVLDKDGQGYVMVRTGKPSEEEFKGLCRLGVRKMIVMAGNGSIEKDFAAKHCPGFEVVYDRVQRTKTPLTKDFLADFDALVADAKAKHYGVAFRCNCGCHRTGRLAAYYHMKYQGVSVRDAVKDQRGKAPGLATLLFRRVIKLQVRALKDYIDGKPCGQKARFCVGEKDASPTLGETDGKDEDEEAAREDADAQDPDASPTEK